jgi:predicted HTH transcriptional regulator
MTRALPADDTRCSVLEAVDAAHAEHDGPVTLREIMRRTGISSTSTARSRRNALVAAGLLRQVGRQGSVVPIPPRRDLDLAWAAERGECV